MKDLKLILALLFFLMAQVMMGQTFVLPDTNLRNKLETSYPQVMQNGELVIAEAAALTGTLNLRFANISDATGVQYFTSISTLDLSDNALTEIPDFSATTGLVNFYASNNQLVGLPDMSALTQLRDFQVMNNELMAFPDLSGATELQRLYCSNNNITQFPPLTLFPNLLILVIGENPIEHDIDFSPAVNLTELHVHKMNINTIIGLSSLKNLTTLFAWGNNIRDFSGLDSITTLELCYIFDNPVIELPYFGNKPTLNTLDVSNCYLTFEDIAPVLQQNISGTFKYAPQREITYADQTVRAENNFTLSYPVSSPLPDNIYIWLKNGEILDSSSSKTYTFSPVTFTDSGSYLLRIYNTSIPDLLLSTETFQVSVDPCIELNLPAVNILDKDCSKGYSIDLSNAEIAGGTAPFTYELISDNFKGTFDDVSIENIPAGQYELHIIDSKNCKATDHFTLNRIERCDPVLTPNGDGVADSYFIEKSGKVKIYNVNRKLITSLQAPVVWDGTDQNGAVLDAGYYIMVIENESPVYITVIR